MSMYIYFTACCQYTTGHKSRPAVRLPIFLVGAKILERVEHVQLLGRSVPAP